MKNHIFIQAREKSERFPEKILQKICGKSIVTLMLERIEKIQNIDNIFLITGPKESNKQVISEFKRNGIEYFSGSEENILDRFYHAAKLFDSENIIRLTGDNPLLDFNIINDGMRIFFNSKYDILSNNRKKTYPLGFNFELFSSFALEKSWKIMSKNFSEQRDFLKTFIPPTVFMLENQNFKNFDLTYKKNISNIRLTLDYFEDFQLISKIFESLYQHNKFFGLDDVLKLLEKNPKLLEINKKHCAKFL